MSELDEATELAIAEAAANDVLRLMGRAQALLVAGFTPMEQGQIMARDALAHEVAEALAESRAARLREHIDNQRAAS